jgi:glucose/arabinose dehydrogenase
MRKMLVVVALAAACAPQPSETRQTEAPAPEAVSGLRVERVVTDLAGPTQMTFGPDGRLWVAQLSDGENERRGQVLAIDLDSGDREVVISGLDKPTGIAWLGGDLWIATRDALLRARGPGSRVAEPDAVLSDLPNNGRSNGTLTPTPDGLLLYETSGREREGGFVEGSGTLWELDPAQPDDPQPVATGLKNAYAHVFDRDGVLWSTEIAEPIGGSAAPDELNRIERGADYGWPACVGDRQPVAAFGGDRERCQDTVRPVTQFGPGTTATAVVMNPFAAGELIVTLWVAGQVVSVDADGAREPRPFLEGLPHPQSLLVDGDTLLVSDHEQGAIYRVSEPAA